MKPSEDRIILVTGATGYVGTRLTTALLGEGFRVRAAGRSREKLRGRRWASHPRVELAAMDACDPDSVKRAVKSCSAVYYMIHSMLSSAGSFEENDRAAARLMSKACSSEGVDRIIYLSGLGNDEEDLSRHLRSRREVETVLKEGGTPVTILRAAMILGSGSASFEILRYLVDRLPVMITPRWVKTPSQPIAITDVLGYLVGCLKKDETSGKTYEIGGPEVLTYEQIMKIYAEEAGLRRRVIVPVPVLTPRLSSYWIHLVTPVPAAIARPLAEGLRNPVVCRDNAIRDVIPLELLDCREAIRLALENTGRSRIESHWTDAGAVRDFAWAEEGDPAWAGGTFLEDKRNAEVRADPSEVWPLIAGIGGTNGWYHADFLWRIRGLVDRLAGGVGLRRGRRHPSEIAAGDALDFWRVLRVREGEQLLLGAEMKLPGEATLEFRVRKAARGSVITQTARFRPRGLAGILYWYALLPFHGYIFGGMLKEIARRIDNQSGERLKPPAKS